MKNLLVFLDSEFLYECKNKGEVAKLIMRDYIKYEDPTKGFARYFEEHDIYEKLESL